MGAIEVLQISQQQQKHPLLQRNLELKRYEIWSVLCCKKLKIKFWYRLTKKISMEVQSAKGQKKIVMGSLSTSNNLNIQSNVYLVVSKP
jgi:hypothetical protein